MNAAKLHETALHHAAKVKNVDLIEMLIQFGGNIYARDNRGRKPSDYTWASSAPARCLEHYESECVRSGSWRRVCVPWVCGDLLREPLRSLDRSSLYSDGSLRLCRYRPGSSANRG